MLDRVGPNGLPMTPSGWMKPGDVFDCITETGMQHDWYGQATRENMTPPVLLLRESMQRIGLVQKLYRQLAWTAAGERLRGDPLGLWNYLAAKTPLGQKATQDAGRIVLLLVANGLEPAVERFLPVLIALGWGYSPTAPIKEPNAYSLAKTTLEMLVRLGGLKGAKPGAVAPNPTGGVAFAKAARRSSRPGSGRDQQHAA